MTRNLLFAACLLVTAASCRQDSGAEEKAPAGLKFVHHIQNDGPKPKEGDFIVFQVEMTNGDSVIYSSYHEPDVPMMPAPGPGEIAGQYRFAWMEGLLLMSEGDSMTVYIPVDSIGRGLMPAFKNSEYVTYNLSLREIKSGIREETLALLGDFKEGKLGGRLRKTPSGLQYVVVEEGAGTPAAEGQTVACHYYGMLMDGNLFESSYFTGKAFSFPLGMGQVIPGWDEAFTLLKPGTKAVLFVPNGLAYGERARPGIPAGADLVFYIDFLRIE